MPKPASLRAPGITLIGLMVLLAGAALAASGWARPAPVPPGPVGARAAASALAQGLPGGAVQKAEEETHGGRLPADAEARAEHPVSIWRTVARLFNFAVLVGVLVYFARSPFVQYLVTRSRDIRQALADAAAAREAAAARMAEIERRLEALPAELEALRRRGAEEIAAEETRLRETTELTRARLVDQARREIDLRVRLAERELRQHAADLAVAAATARVTRMIDQGDQLRLVDQYLGQIGARS